MSAFAYGRMMRNSIDERTRFNLLSAQEKQQQPEKPQDKLTSAAAALIPADVLMLHALLVSLTTTTDDKGTTVITNAMFLGASFWALLGVTALLYLIGRGHSSWTGADIVRLGIPLGAFVAWTALVGTSALTPLVGGRVPQTGLVFAAGIVAVVLAAINEKVKPKKT